MKRSAVVCSQHIGRMIKFHWHKKGKIKVVPTTTAKVLKSQGFDVVDVEEYLNSQKQKESVTLTGHYDKEIPFDENHPNYKRDPCYMLRDGDVLVEGLDQAKALTNTVELSDLPEKLVQLNDEVNVPESIHEEVKKRILLCSLLEATQAKLPIRKDPLRPAWNFPRDYGIPDVRRNELLCKNLVMICDQYRERKNHCVVTDAFFSVPFKAHAKKIQFEMTSELVVTSSVKIQPMTDPSFTFDHQLPDLQPLTCTIGLKPFNFYEMDDIYSFGAKSKYPYIQTAFVHLNYTQVKNEYEEPLTESQIQGRSLLKGFCLAAAEARAFFGSNIRELPEPIVVPLIHTDGKMFHFVIYQLNTLQLDEGCKMKNIFWNSPRIPLYEVCEYIKGRPTLEQYNKDVINRLLTFISIK